MVMFLPGSAFGLSEFDFSNPGLPVEFPLRVVSLTWKFVDRSYVVVIKYQIPPNPLRKFHMLVTEISSFSAFNPFPEKKRVLNFARTIITETSFKTFLSFLNKFSDLNELK